MPFIKWELNFSKSQSYEFAFFSNEIYVNPKGQGRKRDKEINCGYTRLDQVDEKDSKNHNHVIRCDGPQSS